MPDTGLVALVAIIALIVGGALGFFYARWIFFKQLKKIEEDYQKSVKKTYREMGSFFGRKMSEEDLNKITAQLEEKTAPKPNKTSPKKIKPKPKKKK